jgi:hypothetical protein
MILLTLAGAGAHSGAISSSFADLTPPAVEGVILGIGACTTTAMSVSVTGDGTFSYAWSVVDGEDGWTVNTDPDPALASSATFTFANLAHGDIQIAAIKCEVTRTDPAGSATLAGTARARGTSTF